MLLCYALHKTPPPTHSLTHTHTHTHAHTHTQDMCDLMNDVEGDIAGNFNIAPESVTMIQSCLVGSGSLSEVRTCVYLCACVYLCVRLCVCVFLCVF
jgi:hypothetical protein